VGFVDPTYVSIRAEVIEIMSIIIRRFASTSVALAALVLGGTALASPGHAQLTPDQKAKLEAPKQAERAARAELDAALAAQIEKGAIDRAALAPQIAKEKQAEANVKAALDAVLTPEQKAEMQKHRDEHKAKQGEGKRHHEGANLNLTPEQKAQIKARMAAEPKGDRGVERKIDRFDAMVPVLTQAQRAQLAAKLRTK
jgi:Spy/CpxP family protein refolding chaperone